MAELKLITIFLSVVLALGLAVTHAQSPEECYSCEPFPEDLIDVRIIPEEELDPEICSLKTVTCSTDAPEAPKLPEIEEMPQETDIPTLIEQIGQKYGLSDNEIERLKRIAYCESKYNPSAISQTNDFGLYQINARFWNFDMDRILEPEYNIEYAISVVYPAQGFNAWVCNRLI